MWTGGDSGLVEASEDFGFAFKPNEAIRILRERLGEDFEGDVTIQLGVPCSIHFTIPPSPILAVT